MAMPVRYGVPYWTRLRDGVGEVEVHYRRADGSRPASILEDGVTLHIVPADGSAAVPLLPESELFNSQADAKAGRNPVPHR